MLSRAANLRACCVQPANARPGGLFFPVWERRQTKWMPRSKPAFWSSTLRAKVSCDCSRAVLVRYEKERQWRCASILMWRQKLTLISQPVVVSINRSEEHTSELQSHSFISYAVFCLKK